MTKITKLNKKAMTLIEVVSALVLVSVGLVAILGMFSLSSKVTVINEQKFIATKLLSSKMEEILSLRFKMDASKPDISPWTGAEFCTASDVCARCSCYEGFPDYVLEVKQTLNHESNKYLKRVDVTISWEGVLGERTETVSTLIADFARY